MLQNGDHNNTSLLLLNWWSINVLWHVYHVRERGFEHANIPKLKVETVVIRAGGSLNGRKDNSRRNLIKGTTFQKLVETARSLKAMTILLSISVQ